MSAKIWLIADTHFNHDNIATYCERPKNFTERVIKNWQALVAKNDLIVHLGDVIIGKRQTVKDTLKLLPGHKVLVLGNHDRSRGGVNWWVENGFDAACSGMVVRNTWLTHVPAEKLAPDCVLNIHGHMHNVWDGFVGTNKVYVPQKWHRLFALEYTNYMPVEFEKFLAHPKRWKSVPPVPPGF